MALLFKSVLILLGLALVAAGAYAVVKRRYEDADAPEETGLAAVLLGAAKVCVGLVLVVSAFKTTNSPSGEAPAATAWLFRLCIVLSGLAGLMISAKAVLRRQVNFGEDHQHEVTGVAAVVLGLAGVCISLMLMFRGLRA